MSDDEPVWPNLEPEMFTVEPGIMTPAIRKELAALWDDGYFRVEISESQGLAPLKAAIGRLVDIMQNEAERVRGSRPLRAQVRENFIDAVAYQFAELFVPLMKVTVETLMGISLDYGPERFLALLNEDRAELRNALPLK